VGPRATTPGEAATTAAATAPIASTRATSCLGDTAGMSQRVDVAAVLSQLDEPWSPRTVAVLNDYDIRVVKTKGEFTRHSHPETDEVFLVLKGSLTIRMDAGDVTLGPGQLYVVPRGVQHQPVSAEGAEALLIEPSATVNTGDTPSELTAERRVV
jgi:mannose-6-phosphate isomerase-like protein (cupin superfamily)